jgi:hypothetical protein
MRASWVQDRCKAGALFRNEMLCETFAMDHREQRIRRNQNRSIESGRTSLWFHQQQYRATAQASV